MHTIPRYSVNQTLNSLVLDMLAMGLYVEVLEIIC